MTNHTESKTKTERIRELLREGLTPREVANRLGTSREYVYKEKGRMKRGGVLVEQQSLSISDGVNGITIVKDQENAGKYVDYQPEPIDRVNREFGEYDIPPLDKENIMSMYDAFGDNMSPAEVIAKFGIRPDISQREHQRYLIMNSRDPFDLQNRIVGGIINAPPEILAIIDKSKGNLLTNDELLLVINFKIGNFAYLHISDTVLNPAISVPYRVQRPKCRICKAMQPGVIYDVTTYLGAYGQKLIDNVPCQKCMSVMQEIQSGRSY